MLSYQSTSREREPAFGWRLRIGMLLPSVNVVAEGEIASMLPDGVSLHTTRLRLKGSDAASLQSMADSLEDAAGLLEDAGVDIIVFHCTAVSTFDIKIEQSLKKRIEAATKKPATTTAEALVAAFRALGVNRSVLVTPYSKDINEREVAFLAHHKIKVLNNVALDLKKPEDFSSLEPGQWYRHVRTNRHPDADSYFISCTAIRTARAIAPLETDLGRPVITSNQAMAWHVLRAAGIKDAIAGFGKLFN